MTIKLRPEAYSYINDNIPRHMHEALIDYFEQGLRPGSFLEAVLANDLVGAVGHADHVNSKYLKQYVEFLWWHVPGRPNGGWGSYEAMEKWIADAREELSLADAHATND